MKAFQAYANGGTKVTKETAQAAAVAFFEENPGKRKCDVIQGELDGHFFTVKFGRVSPPSWKNVTKKTAKDLPDTVVQ